MVADRGTSALLAAAELAATRLDALTDMGAGVYLTEADAEIRRLDHLEIRAGVHTGEVERRGQELAGIAVHIGARVAARASAGEVLVSGTVPPLVVGSGLNFADRGEHQLKGVPGTWRLFAVTG
jgi:class 3 adenylate cyclase